MSSQPTFIDKLDKSLILEDRDSSYEVRIYSIESNSVLKFYCLLQFISFVRCCPELGKKEILNDQPYITVQFQLVNFMKTLQVNLNSYQRKQFFDDLMGPTPPPHPLSSTVLRSKIQKTFIFPSCQCYSTNEELLMKDDYPFHFPPSFFFHTSTINL